MISAVRMYRERGREIVELTERLCNKVHGERLRQMPRKVSWKGFKEDGESPSRGRNYERLVFEKETRSTNFASSGVISYKSAVKPYRIQVREQYLSYRDNIFI